MKTKVSVCGKQKCFHNVYGICTLKIVSLNEDGKCVCYKQKEDNTCSSRYSDPVCSSSNMC